MSGNRFRPLLVLLASALGLVALLAMPSGAAAKDRNHDRIPDGWERSHHLSLKANQARRDQDRDGLRNRGEFLADDRPHNEDTDGDGVEDGDENAGTIQSFTPGATPGTGRLVINLFSGDTVSGQVTPDTEIECEGPNEAEGDNHDGEHGDENESGDDRLARDSENSGPGSENSGPGNADEDGDENDEHGERDCSAADLTPDTVVHEAELDLSGAGVVFEEIELVK
jgi:hypothetical protein